ncbi:MULTISPECIES: very short patch repair endonuclease [unclassified Cupriavidus]|uniref:very short patch repair endonuclease n=1 Tax=unclassified Cupriavidus TaxID=2640874 RepID=UPI000B82F00C|nr:MULTISPECIES: very short patch repair endonuclease [unclassified Cupriavidus]
MVDVVPPEIRSRMMSGIRGKDTKPELALRKGLHRLGLRYSLRRDTLPGKPDIVFRGRRTVVFFHGCFWHGHVGCPLFKIPSTRPEFWTTKIEGNRARDDRVVSELLAEGWRVAIVRECAIRGRGKRPIETVCEELAEWIRSGNGTRVEIAAMDHFSTGG